MEYGVCSHCLRDRSCRVWRRPKPIKITFSTTNFDPSILPETVETLICPECLSEGSVLVVADILDAELINA